MKVIEYPVVLKKLAKIGNDAKDKYLTSISALREAEVCRVDLFDDHRLKGKLKKFRELHLDGDLLLVYKEINNEAHIINIFTHKQLKNFKGAEEDEYILELGYNFITL